MTDTANTNTDVNNKTFLFVVSWVVTIFLLTLASKNRIGYTIIYYALLLLILLIVVTEYQTLAPLFGSLDTPLAFDQSLAASQNTGPSIASGDF